MHDILPYHFTTFYLTTSYKDKISEEIVKNERGVFVSKTTKNAILK